MAIDPYIETNIVSPTEKTIPGKDFIEWGTNNLYPNFLQDLYDNVATLRSVIDGCVDYIAGDDVTILPLRENMEEGVMNGKGDTIQEQIRDVAQDEETYGGFALQVIRGKDGKPSEVYYIDMRFLRMNKECNVFYYCEDWKRRGKKNVIVYPKFDKSLDWAKLTDEERNRHASSILFVKGNRKQTYPSPRYAAVIKPCETERCVDDFHLNEINNGFAGSYIVNFNNGRPTPEVMEEIEKLFNEKFAGHKNAGRLAFSWNENRATATTIESIQVVDFSAKYQSLEKTARQRIFTAFRANPNLFGIPTESLGFSQEEYESAFRLFNRTHVRPIQRKIADAYDTIYGQKGVLTIVPFSMDEESATDTIVK
jgi:capsid portal protein